jgi:TonB family protein
MKKILILLSFVSLTCWAQNTNEVTEKDSIYSIVDQPAQFPGGNRHLFSYIDSVLVYPKDAMKDSIQGKVYVKFVVDKTGKTTQAKVIKSLSPTTDAEALRVISKMPKWTPAKQAGENVPVYYTLPISFKIKPQVTTTTTTATTTTKTTTNKKTTGKK